MKTNKVTKKQRRIMNRHGEHSPICHKVSDASLERIAEWAIDNDLDLLEVESHRAFYLVAFSDGSVHHFDFLGFHKNEIAA